MSSSTGLLGTHVTWQDVELEIQKTLGTTAKFGENWKMQSTGDMKGFMSKIALIEPDWTGTESKDKDLPEKIAVKISSSLGIMEFFSAMTYLADDSTSTAKVEKTEEEKLQEAERVESIVRYHHNLEVKTYQFVTDAADPKLQSTKIYASKAYSEENRTKGFLVCEFIPNVFPVTNHDTVAYRDFAPVFDTIAAFSAMGEKLSEEEKSKTAGFGHLEGRVSFTIPVEKSAKVQAVLEEALGDEFSGKIQKVMQIIDVICGTSSTPGILSKYSKIADILGHRPVLLHSDLWLGNMLFTKDPSDGHLDFKAIIDFQSTSLGSPGLDVAWVAVCCLTSEDRRQYKDTYLQRYFESFKDSIKGLDVPYTFQHLSDSYDLCFVPIALQILPIFWCMTKYTQPEETLQVARDKMIGLVEDLIEIHEANLEKFPEFFE